MAEKIWYRPLVVDEPPTYPVLGDKEFIKAVKMEGRDYLKVGVIKNPDIAYMIGLVHADGIVLRMKDEGA